MPGKAADVHFVNHGFAKRNCQRLIALPIVMPEIHGRASHARSLIVASPGGRGTVIAPGAHRLSVRIEQNFVPVKAQSQFRSIGAGDAIGVALSRADVRHPNVPVMSGAIHFGVQFDHPAGTSRVFGIE
jgi:hypothetical protein